MDKIYNITEAFSVQPCVKTTCSKENDYDQHDKKYKHHVHTKDCIVEIKEEVLQVSDTERQNYYIGYDINGNKLFQFIAKACNVEYFNK